MAVRKDDFQEETCSRRDVLAALAKYSAVVGGSAATIVTAESLVSAASAYPAVCATRPWLPACPGGSPPGQSKNSNSSASGAARGGRVRF